MSKSIDKKAEQPRGEATLAQQEPVSWERFMSVEKELQDMTAEFMRVAKELVALKAQPSKPLTDEQINLFINGRGEEGDDDYVEPTGDGFCLTDADLVQLVRRVEVAHGIMSVSDGKGNA